MVNLYNIIKQKISIFWEYDRMIIFIYHVDIYIYTCVCTCCVNPQTLCQYEQFSCEFQEFDLRTMVRPKMQVLGGCGSPRGRMIVMICFLALFLLLVSPFEMKADVG